RGSGDFELTNIGALDLWLEVADGSANVATLAGSLRIHGAHLNTEGTESHTHRFTTGLTAEALAELDPDEMVGDLGFDIELLGFFEAGGDTVELIASGEILRNLTGEPSGLPSTIGTEPFTETRVIADVLNVIAA